jgi:hypothetical protein
LTLTKHLNDFGHRIGSIWRTLPTWQKLSTLAALALVIALAILATSGSAACATQADAEAQLEVLMQDLQKQASDGTLGLDTLAQRVTRINTAAEAFARTGDPEAYCTALEALR